MKRTLLFIMCVLASLTMSAQDGLAVEDIQNSGCLAMTRGEEYVEPVPTIVLTKEGSLLSVQLLNLESNCATADFIVKSNISGGSDGTPCSVNVSVTPYLPGDEVANCMCPYNVSFTVHDVEANSFYLKCWWYEGMVTLEDGEPLVLEDVWEEATIDDVRYTLRKAFGRAKIEDGSTTKGEYRIPSELNYEGRTYSVTSIDYSAFRNNKNLTKVTIPQTVKNMDLSDNVGIDSNPFSGCTALRSIEVEEGNPAVCAIDGVLFNKGKAKILCYPPDAQLTSYTVPESVTSVAGLAFSYSQHLQKVSLSDKVTSLGASVFYENQSVEEVRMPSKLSNLGSWMFTNCSRLKSVTIPQGVTSIGRNAFQGCTSLTSVTMPESVKEVDYSVFEGCTSLESVSLSPKLEHIMHNMFADCRKLKELIIPDSVTWIMPNAFKNCTTLKTLDLPKSVYRLGSMLFAGCKLDTLNIRGIIESRWMSADIFRDMGTQTKVFVQPSEVEKFKAIYKGPVHPLSEAQDDSDYIPFVQEGKRWIVFRSDYETGWHLEQYMLMNEEILKDGKTYMKMYRSEDEMDEVYDTGLFREEGRKVYIFDTDRQEELLMFDYSLKAGDTYWAHSDDEGKMVSYKVISVDDYQEGPEVIRYDYNQEGSLIKHRRYLKKWTVCRTDNESLQMIWIEGVGSLEGPLGNLHDVVLPGMTKDYLGFVEYLDYDFIYLPFSFCDTLNGQVYGCNLPTGAADHSMVFQHQLNYELEGDRLHVYGKVFTQCGPNNYAYFCERNTDDPLIHKIEFFIQEVEPTTDCRALHVTDFYVPGFDPNLNYIVVDNQGEEHPVINKNTQMAYRPFIEEGKVWTVKVISDWWPTEEWTEYYYFDGDTIVNNQNAKRMLCDKIISGQNINGEYVGAWYEQDKKVYYAANQHQQFVLLYDFTLSSGDKIQAPGDYIFVVNKISGSITGFKGTYYDFWLDDYWIERWLESVGSEYWPYLNHSIDFEGNKSILLSCGVGDEIIYYNSEEEDPYVMGARKRIDFTHTIKTKPKMPRREPDDSQGEEGQLYGEYNNLQLDINLNPLDDAYLVRITDETGKTVYEKNVNAASIVGLNIDISTYSEGRYTVTVENGQESFTGVFETVSTGISDTERLNDNGEMTDDIIYNLQGQRILSPQKGLNILNGQKVFVK